MSVGVGITAQSEEDALSLFQQVWPAERMVSIQVVNDFSDIDQKHVAPNMGDWLRRGIWFPLGHAHILN